MVDVKARSLPSCGPLPRARREPEQQEPDRRVDFQPGATPQEIAETVRRLREQHGKPDKADA